jgi:hypothetical protein
LETGLQQQRTMGVELTDRVTLTTLACADVGKQELTQIKAGCTPIHADGDGSSAGAEQSLIRIGGVAGRPPLPAIRPGCLFSRIPSAFISVHPASSA